MLGRVSKLTELMHRIGGRSEGKTRPIVAKFLLSEHKNLIKSALARSENGIQWRIQGE